MESSMNNKDLQIKNIKFTLKNKQIPKKVQKSSERLEMFQKGHSLKRYSLQNGSKTNARQSPIQSSALLTTLNSNFEYKAKSKSRERSSNRVSNQLAMPSENLFSTDNSGHIQPTQLQIFKDKKTQSRPISRETSSTNFKNGSQQFEIQKKLEKIINNHRNLQESLNRERVLGHDETLGQEI